MLKQEWKRERKRTKGRMSKREIVIKCSPTEMLIWKCHLHSACLVGRVLVPLWWHHIISWRMGRIHMAIIDDDGGGTVCTGHYICNLRCVEVFSHSLSIWVNTTLQMGNNWPTHSKLIALHNWITWNEWQILTQTAHIHVLPLLF